MSHPNQKNLTSKILPIQKAWTEHHLASLLQSMRHWWETGRVPPVLLFTGPQGIGKREMSYYLAQWLLCDRSRWKSLDSAFTSEPCGKCNSCMRALHHTWVDFQEITATDQDADSHSLKIDQFQNLKASQGFGAFEGSLKIILISDAEQLTLAAANSLLKILEEPPQGWVFLLTAEDSSRLLPTLVSRCQIIKLKPLPPLTLTLLLQASAAAPERIPTATEFAQGSLSKALQLVSDDVWSKRDTIFKFFENPKNETSPLIDWVVADPKNFTLALGMLEHSIFELIQWSLDSQKKPSHPSLQTHAMGVTKKMGSPNLAREFWIQQIEEIFKTKQNLPIALNKKLVAQNLLLPWLEAQ